MRRGEGFLESAHVQASTINWHAGALSCMHDYNWAWAARVWARAQGALPFRLRRPGRMLTRASSRPATALPPPIATPAGWQSGRCAPPPAGV